MEHRASERSFYDKLQLPENQEARDYLESLLADSGLIYEEICRRCKSSMFFENLKDVTPQDLTRYRQRKAQEETRARVVALIEAEGETLFNAAAKNPSGAIGKFLRHQLTQQAIARFDAEMGEIDAVDISREAARHARVEQVDRKLDLEGEKLELERKRIELQQVAADLQRDKYKIASDVWAFILGWFTRKNSRFVDELTSDSEELLQELEGWIENAA